MAKPSAKKPAAKKPTAKKAKKDPNAPKRPKNGYMFFAGTVRAGLMKKGLSIGEVGKETGKLWAACKDQAKYQAMADKDKARYEKEMKSYKPKK